MKLTASKMSRGALASINSGKRIPREGRSDVGALVGTLVGCTMISSSRVGARAGRVGVGVSSGKGTCSCKSGKDESRDDFELHIAFFCC